MKFDKEKVFTPFNCEEVRIGSTGYFADDKEDLISRIKSENKNYYSILEKIDNNSNYSFKMLDGGGFLLFLLSRRAKERNTIK